MACPCGCDERIELLKEQRLRAAFNFERTLQRREVAHELDLRNRRFVPVAGWRLNDILGAPMRAHAESVSEPTQSQTAPEVIGFGPYGVLILRVDGGAVVHTIGDETTVRYCQRSRHDQHWCLAHSAVFHEGAEWCEWSGGAA